MSEFSTDGHNKADDAAGIPFVSGSSCSRLLSEFHILSEIGRGAFGDVIKVIASCIFASLFVVCCHTAAVTLFLLFIYLFVYLIIHCRGPYVCTRWAGFRRFCVI